MGEAIRHVLQTMFHHLLKKSGVVTSQTGFSAQFGTVTMSDPDNTDRLFCLFLPLFSLLAYMVAKAEKRRTEVSTKHTSSSTLHVLFHHLHHNMGYMLTTHISYTWDISPTLHPYPLFQAHACMCGWVDVLSLQWHKSVGVSVTPANTQTTSCQNNHCFVQHCHWIVLSFLSVAFFWEYPPPHHTQL